MSGNQSIELKDFIRDIPDYPKPGILFKDITPLLGNSDAFRSAVRRMADQYREKAIDVVVAAEARGFIFAAPIAVELGAGFVPVRKPGKLPFQRRSHSYELEYGTDTLEMHIDGVQRGQRVLIVDDLLATGGTVEACCEIVRQSEASIVGCAFLIELLFLNGAKRLQPCSIFSLIQYG